jgi:hypothetical protein
MNGFQFIIQHSEFIVPNQVVFICAMTRKRNEKERER